MHEYFPNVTRIPRNEQPFYSGWKRKYRKVKWSKYDYWTERYPHFSKCWKDQRGKGRNKRNTQYRPVCA